MPTLRVPSSTFLPFVLSHRSVVISLVGMRFHVRIGILPHEREHAQELEVDVSVTRGDAEHGVLDYRSLYAVVTDRMSREPLDYLEDVAVGIAERAVALDGVTRSRVAVRKPQVLVGGPLAYAEVVVERSRD
ncbi:MAG: dihydroneopterin aldolase [bacterium]